MDEFNIIMGILLTGLFLFVALFIGLSYDITYIKPIADNTANDLCKLNGFDQYKTFSRIGLFSKVPVGIKCEYAERYTDLGVRNN